MTRAEHGDSPRDPADWPARYQFDAHSDWRDCRIIDLSFEGAAVELYDVEPVDPLVGRLNLEISSIASDQVGVALRTVIRRVDRPSDRGVVVDVDFAQRREESLLLHLLVRLRNYV
jgi:hypothetical protein